MLAATGHHFHVVEVEKGGHYGWQHNMRPLPENVTLLEEGDALAKLREGLFDLVICHNLRDLLRVEPVDIPKVLIFHNKISTEIALGGHQASIDQYQETIRERIERNRLTLVFISESKRENCGFEGPVIRPGINLSEYGGYTGEIERVLRVGNLMKERDIMLGFSWQEEILRDIPSTLLGINPTVSGARVSESWQDLKSHYESHRLFLNSTLHPWEDGYNLAMLEAMATGMPVVSIANNTSPIVHGVNGYISQNSHYLRGKIRALLVDRGMAMEIGLKGRETVEKQFPMAPFVESWNGLFEQVMRGSKKRVTARKPKRGKRNQRASRKAAGKNVLLCYTSNPVTTARYLETSLRASHNVITCGPRMSADMIQVWDLVNMKEKPQAHDFEAESLDLRAVTESIGAKWRPDFFLWVESGIWFPIDGMESLDCPKVCYLIDTHLQGDLHLRWASQFDMVFLAQRAYIPLFRKAGMRNVHWLPLACDPEIHGKTEAEKQFDIGFVGSITPTDARRAALLERLSKRFNVHIQRCFLREMAGVFSASKIVFNNAIRQDLNMRVFEALCSGSFLLTDRAEGSGLEELFQDRKHLVIYEDEDLEDLVQYYLAHEKEREAIAARGRQEVLRRHTYAHRTGEIIRRVESLVESGAFTFSVTDKRGDLQHMPARGRSPRLLFEETAEELERRGCLTEAKDCYLERTRTDPSDMEALVGLGRILLFMNEWKEAAIYLKRAVDGGGQWEPLVLLARCEMKSGQLTEALTHLEMARHHDGQEVSWKSAVQNLIGDCLTQMGDYEKAKATYDQVIGLDAHCDEAWTGLGDLRALIGDCKQAEEAFAKAIAINPKNDRALCGLGLALWKSGQKEEAFEHLQRCLDINPENLTCLNLIVDWSCENGGLHVAETYLRRYLDVHPVNVSVLYSLGEICSQLQKYDEVREVVETILMFQPDHGGAKKLASLIKVPLQPTICETEKKQT
jgi:tetratricopeptide (TPR) repeat protein